MIYCSWQVKQPYPQFDTFVNSHTYSHPFLTLSHLFAISKHFSITKSLKLIYENTPFPIFSLHPTFSLNTSLSLSKAHQKNSPFASNFPVIWIVGWFLKKTLIGWLILIHILMNFKSLLLIAISLPPILPSIIVICNRLWTFHSMSGTQFSSFSFISF